MNNDLTPSEAVFSFLFKCVAWPFEVLWAMFGGDSGDAHFAPLLICLAVTGYCCWQWVSIGFLSWEGVQWGLLSFPFSMFGSIWVAKN